MKFKAGLSTIIPAGAAAATLNMAHGLHAATQPGFPTTIKGQTTMPVDPTPQPPPAPIPPPDPLPQPDPEEPPVPQPGGPKPSAKTRAASMN